MHACCGASIEKTNLWESFHHGTSGHRPRISRVRGEYLYPPETFHRSPILYSLLVVSFTTGKIEIDIVFNIS